MIHLSFKYVFISLIKESQGHFLKAYFYNNLYDILTNNKIKIKITILCKIRRDKKNLITFTISTNFKLRTNESTLFTNLTFFTNHNNESKKATKSLNLS